MNESFDHPEDLPTEDLPKPGEDILAWVQRVQLTVDKCVLDENGELMPATLEEWARFMASPQRKIDHVFFMDGAYLVSTVFLGLDHGFGFGAKPLYFETMVFGPPGEECKQFGKKFRPSLWCERAGTLAGAKATHQAGIDWLRRQDFFEE